MTIRWRLAGLSASLTFVVLCGFAVLIGQLTASRIRSDFNNEMVAAVDDLRDRLVIVMVNGKAKIQTGLNTYAAANSAVIRVVARNPSEEVIAQTSDAPDFPLERTYQRNGYRVETRDTILRTNPGNVGVAVYVQYARQISDVEATVSRVRFFLILGVVGGTALALLGALALSRRALAPITRLTATARDVGRTRDPGLAVPVPDTEDEVAELARTLESMLHALEEAREEREVILNRQRQFVADASHELRTPLTSVLANLELLAEVLDGEQGEAARSALRSTQRMRRLVADLLLLARADAQRTAAHAPTDLGRTLVEAAGELGPMADDHDLEVDVADGVMVDGSRDELHRLALNLMENALKHTPAGTEIRVRVCREGDDALLVVEDDGPGVTPELRGRMFDRFARAAGDGGRSFGLGLAIVRAVAESHGGTVVLDESRETGARFVVRLPLVKVAVPEPVGV